MRNTSNNIKEKLANSLGTLGIILYYIFQLLIYVLPFVMIGANFFVSCFLIFLNMVVPFASAVFWIWGLVCAIQGVQDFFAILYYIVFGVAWVPYFISIIISLFAKKE